MTLLHLPDVLARVDLARQQFVELPLSPDLSAGVDVLLPGQEAAPSTHREDEIYYVLEGRARVRVGEETQPVSPGSFVFVPAGVPHRFEGIEGRLLLLVVFGPAYRSRDPPASA